jgi:hypothetical protein
MWADSMYVTWSMPQFKVIVFAPYFHLLWLHSVGWYRGIDLGLHSGGALFEDSSGMLAIQIEVIGVLSSSSKPV